MQYLIPIVSLLIANLLISAAINDLGRNELGHSLKAEYYEIF